MQPSNGEVVEMEKVQEKPLQDPPQGILKNVSSKEKGEPQAIQEEAPKRDGSQKG